IMNMVVPPTRSRISKGECSAVLAFVAMAQKNMDLTTENLATHKDDLPIPHLPGLETIDFGDPDGGAHSMFCASTSKKGHPINVPSSISDPWRNSTYKGNGYPPPPSYLASPPITSGESSAGDHTEAPRLEVQQWFLNFDTIRISFAPEKEGIFLFKHTNYIVESKNRQTTVIRRYSDFWWMLEVLTKRFPFRTLPNLPPKRLGVPDEAFLERRLRGLTRFMNALMRHPVLRNDPLVVSFLTEPVELATWRKNVAISTEDEFTTRLPISDNLSKQVPSDLDQQLEIVKKRLPSSIDYCRGMVHVMDRVQKRTEATAADFMRYSLALNALADCEKQCHLADCGTCGRLSQGYGKIGTHMGQASNVLEEQSKATQRGMVEELKRHRDLSISFMELLQRRDRSREGGLIESLQRRIKANEEKLAVVKTNASNAVAAAAAAREAGTEASNDFDVYDSQLERLTGILATDRAELATQEQRTVLMQHTLWMEMTYFHKNLALIAPMYQGFVVGQSKASQGLTDVWQSLSPVVHDLPTEA
ncbi:sorting nexin, partial [Lunasporangiospora selenospora]